MAQEEFRVRVTAETKSATDKIDAVESKLGQLTDKARTVSISVDANAIERSTRATRDIAGNLKQAALEAKTTAQVGIVSPGSLAGVATLASGFYGIRKDVRGLGDDLAKALGKTNVSEFMRTEKFIERVAQNSKARSREIVETYQNLREVPGVADALGPIENYARAQAWQQFGGDIAEQTLKGIQTGLQQGVAETKKFLYGDLFAEIASGTNRTIDTLARLGLAIQGVQLLVGPLASAWSAAFNAIIGQNVRLQETILSTQTTLASTGRVINQATGQEILDPLAKINALEGGVRQAIDNIRVRSLDLAGVTSSQIIDIFGVVATSISQVGGNLKDAENLAISFTAALGTMGIPFYQARQEIGSILGGYITEDSLLAKRLQISNADIEKAKSSVDGVVGYIQEKLKTAVAGQAISARSFSGVTSNIQEVFEVLAQKIGEPLLEPLVSGMTTIYNVLKKIQGVVLGVGTFLSKTIVRSISAIIEPLQKSNIAQGLNRSLNALAAPFEAIGRSVELGFGGRNADLIDEYLKGLLRVPPALQALINGLRDIGLFLSQQINLITEPITQFLDQTRDQAGGINGIVQGFTRVFSIPFGNFVELPDTFTKGWDTLQSTITEASKAIVNFGVNVAKLKIIEITAQIRAAAKVFEVFGSVLLGKINLAISVFDNLGKLAGTDLAKFLVSMTAINRLLNSTEFFGTKGIIVWLTQTQKIFQQLRQDVDLFIKGFRDAGNINNIVANAQAAAAKVVGFDTKSDNPVLRNAAQIDQLTQRIASLNAMQNQMASQGAGAAALSKYTVAINKANEELAKLKQTQESFTKAQRAGAAIKSFFGGGAELAQAKEAARQASVMASGAASAQALSSVMDTLGQRLGLTREQMKGLGGAVNVATKSLQTFLTTSLLINVGFTAATLAIAAGISAWQSYEEAQKKASLTSKNLATIQRILASEYSGIIKAAEGGDIAAQKLLQTQRDLAQSQLSQSTADLDELKKKYSEINDALFLRRKIQKEQIGERPEGLVEQAQNLIFNAIISRREQELTENKAKQVELEKQRFQALQAISKLEREQKVVQDFTVLSERRKDIEEKIAKAREEFTKEITDKEFQTRLELLNIEQQKRAELLQQEKAALTERFRLLSANATEQDQRVLKLVEDYENALLDAAGNEERRRNEMVQREAQMRKAIEDYAYKMGKEKLNLEKQVGKYQESVEKYKNDQLKIRSEKELAAIKQRVALLGAYYQPYNLEQQQKFINAANDRSAPPIGGTAYAYSALQVIPKDRLGLSGLEDPKVAIEALRRYLASRKQRNESNDLESLIRDDYGDTVDPKRLASALKADANRALNLSQFTTKQDPNSIKVPDLKIDYAGMQARIAAAEGDILDAMQSLQESLAQGDKAAIQRTIDRFSDPSVYTDIKADYTSDVKKSQLELRNMVDSLRNFNSGVTDLAQVLSIVELSTRSAIRTTLKQLIESKGQTWTADLEKLFNNNIDRIRSGDLSTIPPDTAKLIAAINRGGNAALNQARSNYSQVQSINSDQMVKAIISDITNQAKDSRGQATDDVFSRMTQLLQQESDTRYSLDRTLTQIDATIRQLVTSQLAKIPTASPDQQKAVVDAANELRKTLIENAKKFDSTNTALRMFEERLEMANRATEALFSSMQQFISGIIVEGQDLSEAVKNYTSNLSKEFLRMALDYSMKPIREQFKQQMEKIFGVPDAKKAAEEQFRIATGSFSTAVDKFSAAVNSMSNNGVGGALDGIGGPVEENANTSGLKYGIRIGDMVGELNAKPPRSQQFDSVNGPGGKPVPLNVAPTQALPTIEWTPASENFSQTIQKASENLSAWTQKLPQLSEYTDNLINSTSSANTGLSNVGAKGQQTNELFSSLQKSMANAVGVLGGLAMAIGGAQTMGGGGTYNTLMGLAGIFGAISSVAGGIGGLFNSGGGGGGGAFNFKPVDSLPSVGSFNPLPSNFSIPSFAGGGYTGPGAIAGGLDGRGGFMAMLHPNETVIPGNPYAATTAALENGAFSNPARFSSEPIKLETRVINGVEYATVDQLEQATRQAEMRGAQRGQAMAFNSMRNNVKTRKQLGMT